MMKALVFTAFNLTIWVSYKQNEMEKYTYIALSIVSGHSNQHISQDWVSTHLS